jgi:hypothetical protein
VVVVITAVGAVRGQIKGELGIDPSDEGVRQYPMYGGIDFAYLEYRSPESGRTLQLAFESEDTVWMVVQLEDGRTFGDEIYIPSASDLLFLVRAALDGEIRVHRSAFRGSGGITITGEQVKWSLEPWRIEAKWEQR